MKGEALQFRDWTDDSGKTWQVHDRRGGGAMRTDSEGQELFVMRFSERELSKDLPDGVEPRPAGWYGRRGDAYRTDKQKLTYLGTGTLPIAVSRFNNLLGSGEA